MATTAALPACSHRRKPARSAFCRSRLSRKNRQRLAGRRSFRSAIQKLDETPQLSPAGEHRPLLKDRTAWHKAGSRAARERQLALDYLARRDYLRAAQFGYEARFRRRYGDPNDFATRKDADNELTQDSKDQAAESRPTFAP